MRRFRIWATVWLLLGVDMLVVSAAEREPAVTGAFVIRAATHFREPSSSFRARPIRPLRFE